MHRTAREEASLSTVVCGASRRAVRQVLKLKEKLAKVKRDASDAHAQLQKLRGQFQELVDGKAKVQMQLIEVEEEKLRCAAIDETPLLVPFSTHWKLSSGCVVELHVHPCPSSAHTTSIHHRGRPPLAL